MEPASEGVSFKKPSCNQKIRKCPTSAEAAQEEDEDEESTKSAVATSHRTSKLARKADGRLGFSSEHLLLRGLKVEGPEGGPSGVSPFVSKVLAPGDVVLDLSNANKILRVGSGLRQDGDCLLATKVGRLRFQKQSNKYWLEGSQKRYIPNVEDTVVGIMVDRRSEMFILDIGGPAFASLPILAFEGATRRNIPNLQVGAAVYARVVNAHRDGDPELSCTDASGKSAGFGPLKGGYIFDCSTGLPRGLLSKPTPPVLEVLGKNLSFEIAVGLNGHVWVNAPKVATTITASNAIQNSEFLSPTQQHIMAKKLLEDL